MKKIISILTAVIILGSSFTAMAKESFKMDSKQKDFLETLDIIPSISDLDDAYVTREMQAVTLMKLLNIDSVDTAIEMGLIDSLDNGESELEQYVRFSETARGLVTALGYKLVVEFNSGDYSKYIELAYSLKISSKLGLRADDYVSEKEFATMIYRLVNTPMISFDPLDKNITNGEDDFTILTQYQEIYTQKGMITANEVTNLSGASNLNKNMVTIDSDNQFKVGETLAKYLVGYEVEYCYREDENSGDDVLLWVYADEEDNGELYVDGNRIEEYNALVYSYDDGRITKKAILDNSVAIIYNGVATAASNLTKKQMMPQIGEITLLNNQGDSKYDVVIIMDYTVNTVSTVNTEKETISFREADTETLNLEQVKSYDIFDKDYSAKKLSDLKNKTVVWKAQSLGNSYVQLLISDKSVTGGIQAKYTDGDDVVLKIDDEKYYIKAVKSADSLSIGLYGTFSLAIDGSIADWTVNIGKDKKFVYVVKAFENEDNERVSVRAFDGEMRVLNCVEKPKLNGERFLNAAALDEIVDGIAIIELNASGEIKSIETPTDRNNNDGRMFTVGSVPKSGEGAGTLYKKYFGNLVCNYFGLADDCTVFVIPGDRTDYNRYRMGGPEMVPNDNTIYGLTGYKTSSEQSRCIAAVYDKTVSTAGTNASSYVPVAITNVSIDLDNNDEMVYNVTGRRLIENTAVSFPVKDEELLDRIKVGNIIRYDVDDAGYAIAVSVDYNYESKKAPSAGNTGGAYGDEYKIRFGTVTMKWEDAVILDTEGLYSYITNQYVPLGYCNVWNWEISRGKPVLKQINTSDISVGDDMIFWQKWGGVNNILVIKN